MKLAILGYGAEGKSVEKYFKTHPYENVAPEDIEIKIFDNFSDEEIDSLGLEDYDVVFRSPSVRPHYDYRKFSTDDNHASNEGDYKLENKKPYWTSATKYFFEHCPCEIIAVSGTKGKGTTCSLIKALLDAIVKFSYSNGESANKSTKNSSVLPKNYLVGNIGVPALDVLDKITALDDVIYEMSSFQLWDLHASSFIGVLLRIEPDHLNVHKDFDEYVYAKSAISRYKTENDYLIYFRNNPTTATLAEKSIAHKLAYPTDDSHKDVPEISTSGKEKLKTLLDCLKVPGKHNRENAEAALLAVAARCYHGDLDGLLHSELYPALEHALKNFEGLPHRCEFVRELNGVSYYDDNYSTTFPSIDVAIKTFADVPTILIAGGKDKGTDITEIKKCIFKSKNVKKAILIGETARSLSAGEDDSKYEFADNLEDAVSRAQELAEEISKDSEAHKSVVLMSPAFASFDMFNSYGERGDLFKKYVNALK